MNDWKLWRSKGIGASDAPVVMGVSPYKTAYELWEEKTGLVSSDSEGNWATRRGHELEPRARANYELEYMISMPIAFVEHREYPFIRASLDGYNEAASRILEIKCPGKADHDLALQGKVPEKYWPQVQHQLFATGAKVCHYYSFDGERGALVEVYPDLEYIEKLVEQEVAFWRLVETQTPPKLSDRDYKKFDDPKVLADLSDYRKISLQIWELEKQQAELKNRITASMTHPNMTDGEIKVSRCFRKGTIDYSKIPDLEHVDLEQFRKSPTTYYTISFDKRAKHGSGRTNS